MEERRDNSRVKKKKKYRGRKSNSVMVTNSRQIHLAFMPRDMFKDREKLPSYVHIWDTAN